MKIEHVISEVVRMPSMGLYGLGKQSSGRGGPFMILPRHLSDAMKAILPLPWDEDDFAAPEGMDAETFETARSMIVGAEMVLLHPNYTDTYRNFQETKRSLETLEVEEPSQAALILATFSQRVLIGLAMLHTEAQYVIEEAWRDAVHLHRTLTLKHEGNDFPEYVSYNLQEWIERVY